MARFLLKEKLAKFKSRLEEKLAKFKSRLKKESGQVQKPAEERPAEERPAQLRTRLKRLIKLPWGWLAKFKSWLGKRLAKFGLFQPFRPKRAAPKPAVESLSAQAHGRLMEQYPVGQAEVFISHDGAMGYYEISEPGLSEREKEVCQNLFENIIYTMDPESVEAEDLTRYIEGAIWKAAEGLGLIEEVRENFAKYRYFLEKDMLGYGKLHILMLDPGLSAIAVPRYGEPVRVFHRRFAELGWLRTNILFYSEAELQNYNLRLASRMGKPLTAAVPTADIMTPEGHRISLTLGDEVTFPGSTLSIRKFPKEPHSLAHLVGRHMLTPLMAAYLWQVFEQRGFVQVIGTIGGGKTTLLNALLASTNPNHKIITAEDVLELRLPHGNWQRFHTRPVHFAASEHFKIDLFDLVMLVMRHQPDYVAVGEVRGEEIKDLTHAAALGHSCASTFHADTVRGAVERMRALGLRDGDILSIWCFAIAAMVRRPTGEVVYRVTDISEVNPTEEGKPAFREIFKYDAKTDSFSPNSAKEVVACSRRLRESASARGLGDEDIVDTLQRKADFLERLVKHGEFGFDQYVKRIREFYAGEI